MMGSDLQFASEAYSSLAAAAGFCSSQVIVTELRGRHVNGRDSIFLLRPSLSLSPSHLFRADAAQRAI